MNEDLPITLEDLLCQVEVNMILSGAASINQPWLDSPGDRHPKWIFPEGSPVRVLISDSVAETDGVEEYNFICAAAAKTGNPFLAFRQHMSQRALELFNAKLIALQQRM